MLKKNSKRYEVRNKNDTRCKKCEPSDAVLKSAINAVTTY